MAQESLVIDVKEKLGQDDGGLWQTSVGPEERVKVAARCAAISDWIDEEVGPATPPKVRIQAMLFVTSRGRILC